MKLTLVTLLALATTVIAQEAGAIENSLNGAILAVDQAEADRKNEEAMIQFEKDMKDAVLAHQTSIKKMTVGSFQMLVQENCNLELPKKPDFVTVTEKDCFKANFNATTTANLVAKATPLNPPSIDMVMRAVNSCELEVSWVKEFEIYNECWGENVPAEYMHIIGPIEQDLRDKGYVRDGNVWRKESEVQHIDLQEERNLVAMP
jgi:hypothetical protein